MRVLGLTGGIGSGKTTVAGFFRELGVPVFIADDEAKNLMQQDERLRQEIIQLFGNDAYHHGTLNRKFIAGQVFANKEKLEQLNAIVHPAVGRQFQAWKEKQVSSYVVYEAAILFEKGGYKHCDFNLLITAPPKDRIERILKRDNSTLEEIEARMEHQWSDQEKEKLADFVIVNSRLESTREAVQQLHKNLLESA